MSGAEPVIPVILFAYARPAHLARVLACLRENAVPLIYAYADGAKGESDAVAVAETRTLLRNIDWCEVRLFERGENLGLGRNVLGGVTEVSGKHAAFVVWEDDLVCVPGTYQWMIAALRHYEGNERVMSVTGWTHPRVTPPGLGDAPYFDGRAECWVWGAWARSWRGMLEQTALVKLAASVAAGVAADAYGADLPAMAALEAKKNIWAVRWLYHHLQRGGLCLRPPRSMVEHIGFDGAATHAAAATDWANPPLRTAPSTPATWPEVQEHPACRARWSMANPGGWRQKWRRLRENSFPMRSLWPGMFRPRPAMPLLRAWRQRVGWRWFRGDYPDWVTARAASAGYDDAAVLSRVQAAVREVQAGRAAWERDGTTFNETVTNGPLVAVLQAAARESAGNLFVVDFGGSLGSTWWQHRHVFADLARVRWCVVEQAHYIGAGAEFAGRELTFHESIDAAIAEGRPHVILLSGVLPYVEKPLELLDGIVRHGFQHVIIDRTPLVRAGGTRLAVQHTPPGLGGGSYPCWLLARESLLARLQTDYTLVQEWPAIDDLSPDVSHRGFHFRRTPA